VNKVTVGTEEPLTLLGISRGTEEQRNKGTEDLRIEQLKPFELIN
jgi:hypothetical protein